MLDMLHSYMSVVCTLVWLLLLVDLCNQKATKGTEIQFFYVRKASSKVEE